MKVMTRNEVFRISESPDQTLVILTESGRSTGFSVEFSTMCGEEFEFSPSDNSWVRKNGTRVYFRDIRKPKKVREGKVQVRTMGFDRAMSEDELIGIRIWKTLNSGS